MPKKMTTRKQLSRAQRRDLDIEISFLEGVVRRDPNYVEALQLLGDDYTTRGRVRDGLQVDQQLAQLRPDDSMVYYNLACSYALTKDYEKAVQALHQALDLGYADFRWLSRDKDLRELRKHPLYKNIRERVKKLKTQSTAAE